MSLRYLESGEGEQTEKKILLLHSMARKRRHHFLKIQKRIDSTTEIIMHVVRGK